MYGLADDLIQMLIATAERYRASKLVLFGSRARGDYRDGSDIDLAVYGLEQRDEMPLRSALDELPTLLKFDMIPVRKETDSALIENIVREGVLLMERSSSKRDQFIQALARTKDAIAQYNQNGNDVIRDGVIQRFEFTTELAWKSVREYLLAEGYVGIDSPKSTMRQAFAAGIIDDEQGWMNLLQARNLTSAMYSEAQIESIFHSITSQFILLFDKLEAKLQ